MKREEQNTRLAEDFLAPSVEPREFDRLLPILSEAIGDWRQKQHTASCRRCARIAKVAGSGQAESDCLFVAKATPCTLEESAL